MYIVHIIKYYKETYHVFLIFCIMYAILNLKKKENKEKGLVYNIVVECTPH